LPQTSSTPPAQLAPALLRLAALLLLGVVAMSGSEAAPARAQLEGAVYLRTGFVPDPIVLDGQALGVRPAAELAPQCSGFVGLTPTHVFGLETRFGYLRLFATSDTNLVLAVRTAEGEWLCSDDRFGLHPSVEGLFTPGRMEVWIGTQVPGGQARYSLRLTENRSVRPGIGAEATWDEGAALARDLGLEIDATTGAHQGLRVRRGFLPDPRMLDGVAGGAIDAGALGGTCRGRIAPRPTHVLTLQNAFDFLQIYVDTEGDHEEELTVVVLTPGGRFLCDLGAGDVPDVSADAWPEGVYRIWVGTVEEDATLRYRLGISEIRRVR
jgi:hypothetical protein